MSHLIDKPTKTFKNHKNPQKDEWKNLTKRAHKQQSPP